MKCIAIAFFLLFYSENIKAQSYSAQMQAEICDCLQQEKIENRLHTGSYKLCFRRALPNFASIIEAEINEEDLKVKMQLALEAKLQLLFDIEVALIRSCDVYYEQLDYERVQKNSYRKTQANPKILEQLDQQIALYPSRRRYLSRAYAHQALGNFKMAEADLKKSIALSPPSDNFENIRTELLLLAEIYEEQGDYGEAIAELDKIPELPFGNSIQVLSAYLHRKSNYQFTKKKTDNKKSVTESVNKNSSTNRKKVHKDSVDLKKLFKLDNKNK